MQLSILCTSHLGISLPTHLREMTSDNSVVLVRIMKFYVSVVWTVNMVSALRCCRAKYVAGLLHCVTPKCSSLFLLQWQYENLQLGDLHVNGGKVELDLSKFSDSCTFPFLPSFSNLFFISVSNAKCCGASAPSSLKIMCQSDRAPYFIRCLFAVWWPDGGTGETKRETVKSLELILC